MPLCFLKAPAGFRTCGMCSNEWIEPRCAHVAPVPGCSFRERELASSRIRAGADAGSSHGRVPVQGRAIRNPSSRKVNRDIGNYKFVVPDLCVLRASLHPPHCPTPPFVCGTCQAGVGVDIRGRSTSPRIVTSRVPSPVFPRSCYTPGALLTLRQDPQ